MSQTAGTAYPVHYDVDRPERFARVHILLRIGGWAIWSLLSNAGLGVLLLAAPVISALLIAQRGGGAAFHERHGAIYRKVLAFYMGIQAYLWLTTDEVPTWGEAGASRLEIESSGQPTVGSALWRLIMVIPSAIVLALLMMVGFALAFVAAITVLVGQSVPDWIRNFLVGLLAWEARLLAYFVSLVEEYPPFSLEHRTLAPA